MRILTRTTTSDAKFREVLLCYRAYEKAREALQQEPDNSKVQQAEVRAVNLLQTSALAWLEQILPKR